MAIDDIIAAGVRAPQITEPWQIQDRNLRLQQLANVGQLQQQAIQQQQIELQNARQGQQDDQAWRQALGDNKGDPTAALTAAAGNVSGASWFKQQAEVIKAHQDQAATAKTQADSAKLQQNYFGKLALGAQSLPQFMTALDTARKTDPAYVPHVDMAAQFLQQHPELFDAFRQQLIDQSDEAQVILKNKAETQRTQALAAQEASLSAPKLREETAKAQQAEQVAAGTEPMTEYQKAETAINKQRDADLNWYHQQLIAQGWSGGAGGGGQTPNSQAVDRRLAAKQLDDLIGQEAGLHRQRLALGNAIESGSIYVDPQGRIKPMDAASGGNEATKAALIEEMKNRFSLATNQVNDVIARKNAIGGQLGIQPRVSTEAAQAAVSAGAKPAAAMPGAPKKLSGQRIRVRLKDGRTGTLDKSEFDPSTMTPVQ